MTKGLASIGIKIKINDVELGNATGMGEIGGDPDELDTTTFKDEVSTSIPGVQKQNAWTVDYLYQNDDEESDYRKLKAFEKEKEAVAIEVEFPDKTTFTNSGYITTKINAVKVNELISATATVSLQKKWTVTNPSGT